MSVGALASENCSVLFRKYMAKWEQAQANPGAAPAETPVPS